MSDKLSLSPILFKFDQILKTFWWNFEKKKKFALLFKKFDKIFKIFWLSFENNLTKFFFNLIKLKKIDGILKN